MRNFIRVSAPRVSVLDLPSDSNHKVDYLAEMARETPIFFITLLEHRLARLQENESLEKEAEARIAATVTTKPAVTRVIMCESVNEMPPRPRKAATKKAAATATKKSTPRKRTGLKPVPPKEKN